MRRMITPVYLRTHTHTHTHSHVVMTVYVAALCPVEDATGEGGSARFTARLTLVDLAGILFCVFYTARLTLAGISLDTCKRTYSRQ